jgi:hypothetical protein
MEMHRFVVKQRPLLEIIREIEQHGVTGPTLSVTIRYDRVLAPRVHERYRYDPTAAILWRCAAGP